MGCSRPFLRLGICDFSFGGSWCFLRLEISIFLVGFLEAFRNFNVRVWSVICVTGLGSLVRAFFFLLVLPTPTSALGPGWSLFAQLFAFLPSRQPPHPVRGHGLGNRAAKQRHGAVGFPCSFLSCRLANALLSTEPGGGQGKMALTEWHRTVRFVIFRL